MPRGDVRELTAKTHVFDVASKAWALPYVHRAARGDDRRRLEALMARMRAPEPSDRPNFTEALDYPEEAPPEEGGVARRLLYDIRNGGATPRDRRGGPPTGRWWSCPT